jgi:Tol biopolymer transport system component
MVALALVALALAVPAGAQSFGRNKVHYGDFDFQVLETPHFDIYYYPAEHDASVEAGRLAERWYARLSQVLDHTFKERQPIVLYASHAQFTQTNIVPGLLGDGVGGVTEHEKGRVVLPFAAGLGETDHVLGHELVHAFQRDILRRNAGSLSMLPLWFVEGMAEYLSLGHIDSNTEMWLRDSVLENRLPRIDQLNDPRFFPYRYGQALWAYLAGRFGDDVVAKCLRSKAAGGAVGRIVAVTGIDASALSAAWQESIRQLVARPSDSPAETLKTSNVTKGPGGRLNVGPALSPDGKSVVFLAQRDQYSIDVVVADVATGTIKRRIAQTAGDPHFESLQFVESAGAWDPSGGRFALAALSRGQPVLTIWDIATGTVERELPVRNVDQIFSPTWSPDGRRIAFSALHNGLSDLYVIDLDTRSVRAITSDPFADLQPAWSPDGRAIAFSTDRFSSSVETLTFGEFRLGLVDVDSGAVSELPSVPGAKNIDPHWTADGASLYFVADGDGISNVYRVDLADGQLFRITDVPTGVSGITRLSPALSVAARTDRLAFSVYRSGGYEIRATDVAPGTPISSVATEVRSSLKSDASASASASSTAARPVSGALTMPLFGAPDGKGFTSRPYHPGLSLDRMVQPYLSAGGGSGGSFVRAGVGLSFGDMLGDHQLQTVLQVGKTLDDFMAQAGYVDMHSRWNWAVIGGQVPWLTGVTPTSTAPSVDSGTATRQFDVFRQLHRQILGMAIYPFSGAKRLELTGGVQSVSFDRETTTSQYSLLTGRLLNETTLTSAAAPGAMLIESGAAVVYDTAVFGPTSPILGERYRIGVAPTFGDLTFTTVSADYRRYVMPFRPFTIAMRVMHLGRYGASNDQRLLPLFWTLRDVVRGYGDLGPGPASDVSANRVVVGNVEVRFPLAALLSRKVQSASLPIEGLVFSDAGRFWIPRIGATSAPPMLRSVGAGVRLNAAGVIFELDAVRPFDQGLGPHGWTFAFNYRPGF